MYYDFYDHQSVSGQLLTTDTAVRQFIYGDVEEETYLRTYYPSMSRLVGSYPDELGDKDSYLFYGVEFDLAYNREELRLYDISGKSNKGFEKMIESFDEKEDIALSLLMASIDTFVYAAFIDRFFPNTADVILENEYGKSDKEIKQLLNVLPLHASIVYDDFSDGRVPGIPRMRWVLAIRERSTFDFKLNSEEQLLTTLQAVLETHAESVLESLVKNSFEDEKPLLYVLAPNKDLIGFRVVMKRI